MGFNEDEGRRRGHETFMEHLRLVNNTPVQLQVRDHNHARSNEVLNFCFEKICEGVTFDVLRRMLGVGPASVDNRWRIIREALPNIMLPVDEEEALRARYSKSLFLLERVEELIKKIDERTEMVDSKVEPQMHRVKFDALKLLIEENRNEFDQYMEIKKLKAHERGNRGVSIIFQNNFHVPRPGESVARKANMILEAGAKVLDESDSSSK